MMTNHKPHNTELQPGPLVECPTCGLPAEITVPFTLGGAPGPVEHMKVMCVRRHWYTLPGDMFPSECVRVRAQEHFGDYTTTLTRSLHASKLSRHRPPSRKLAGVNLSNAVSLDLDGTDGSRASWTNAPLKNDQLSTGGHPLKTRTSSPAPVT
jgi:hypothetical protein